jgi:hypothetical protein
MRLLPQQKNYCIKFLLGYLEIKIQIISLGAPLKKWSRKFNDFTDKALVKWALLIFGIQGPTSFGGLYYDWYFK